MQMQLSASSVQSSSNAVKCKLSTGAVKSGKFKYSAISASVVKCNAVQSSASAIKYEGNQMQVQSSIM